MGAFCRQVGLGVEQPERLGERLWPNLLRDWVFPKLGLLGGEGIARFIRERTAGIAMESLPMCFAAAATDLRNGEMMVLERGDPGRAVQASSSATGLLESVEIAGRPLVNGNPAALPKLRALFKSAS